MEHDIARPGAQPGHRHHLGWVWPTGLAAAWVVGWASGVSWALRELTPRHRRRMTRTA